MNTLKRFKIGGWPAVLRYFMGWIVLVIGVMVLLHIVVHAQVSPNEKLAYLNAISSTILLVVTIVYVRITAKTLAEIKEERLAAFEPLVHVDFGKAQPMAGRLVIPIRLQNFGKGPVIHLRGNFIRRRPKIEGSWLGSSIGELPTTITPGEIKDMTINLDGEDLHELTSDGRHDDFLRLELIYEDARRNLYSYKIGVTVMSCEGRYFLQLHSESHWRKPFHERQSVFDEGGFFVDSASGKDEPFFFRSGF